MIETFIAIKFLKDCGNIQDVETPAYILYPWVVFIVAASTYYAYLRVFRSNVRPYISVTSMNHRTLKMKSS